MKELLERIGKRFTLSGVTSDHGTYITCEKKETVSLVTYLKEVEGFTHLILLTAVDWIEENRFQLTYLLAHPGRKERIGVRTSIPRSIWPEESEMESIHHLWPAAKTYQRELHEMFGIDFPGSPEINEPLIFEYWDDLPPYRRDFDTKTYTEQTYFPRAGRETADPAEHMRQELYSREGEK